MSKTLPISEVKARLPELQRDTLDILSDPDMMKQIRQSRRFYVKNTKGLSFEDVFGEPRVPVKKRAR